MYATGVSPASPFGRPRFGPGCVYFSFSPRIPWVERRVSINRICPLTGRSYLLNYSPGYNQTSAGTTLPLYLLCTRLGHISFPTVLFGVDTCTPAVTIFTAFPFVDNGEDSLPRCLVSSHSVDISSGFTPLGDTRKLEGLDKISFLFPVLPCQKAG